VLDGLALARLAVREPAAALQLALRAVRCARALAPGGKTLALAYKLNTLGLALAAIEAGPGGSAHGAAAVTAASRDAPMTWTHPGANPPVVAWAVFAEAAAIAIEQCGLDHSFTLCTSWNEASVIRAEEGDGRPCEGTVAAPKGARARAWAVGDAAYRALFPDEDSSATPRAHRASKLDPDHPLTQDVFYSRPGKYSKDEVTSICFFWLPADIYGSAILNATFNKDELVDTWQSAMRCNAGYDLV
jgi:hypothetical protein